MNDLSFVHEICKSGLWKWSPSENLTEIMEFFRRSCIFFLWLISKNKISESYRIIIFNMYSQKNGFCHLYRYLLHFRSRSPPQWFSRLCVNNYIILFAYSFKHTSKFKFMKTNKHILLTQKGRCKTKKMKISIIPALRRLHRIIIRLIQSMLSPFKYFFQ
jgi:hypothetical protein